MPKIRKKAAKSIKDAFGRKTKTKIKESLFSLSDDEEELEPADAVPIASTKKRSKFSRLS